jgi:hypothetical protein
LADKLLQARTESLINGQPRVAPGGVNNYLRVAGRQTNMDVRSYAGMSGGIKQPWSASIGRMVMASYANDAQGFNDARAEAVERPVKDGGYKLPEAKAKVLQEYEDHNPLKIVFKSTPNQQEYQKMLAAMDENGRVSTATAVRLYQHYGEQLAGALDVTNKRGAERPFSNIYGRGATQADHEQASAPYDATIRSMMARFQPQNLGLDDLRQRATVGM